MENMIDVVKIKGGKSLAGAIEIQGAKNEALQTICATLLTDQKVVIKRVPEILDVLRLIDTIKFLGVSVENPAKGEYVFEAKNIDTEKLKSPEYRKMVSQTRGALMISGALLSRVGFATMSRPGGDKIGIRPIDVHLNAFEALGAKIDESNADYRQINISKKKNADFYLHEISVTGTANAVLAAVISKSAPEKITIRNAACEPYVVGLCELLISMGAKIEGVGTNTLHIETVESLAGAEHALKPDFVEAGSLIGLAVVTESEILLKGVTLADLGFMIPYTYEIIGIKIEERPDGIFIPKQASYKISKLRDGHLREVYDAPWPGLTPDLLSILVVVAAEAKGVLKIHQKMFEKRLFFVDILQEMGAQIEICDPHRVVVIGLNREHKLRGVKMASPDIRAGMALLISALAAEGESVIENASQISRGYENIFERLKALGADIELVDTCA